MRDPSKFLVILIGSFVFSVVTRGQQAAPVGVASVATDATIGNDRLSAGSTIFSGDLLKTGDQGRVTIQSGTLQFVMGPDSILRLFRVENRTLAEVERGTLVYSAKGVNEELTLFALDIRLVPKTSVLASGQVRILSRCDVTVTALHSMIEVTSGRESKTIQETKSYKVLSEFGVDYRDSWQPGPTDYPEYPRDTEYHRSHAHVACPAGVSQTAPRSPVGALATGHFAEIAAGGGVGVITSWAVHEAVESPDKP